MTKCKTEGCDGEFEWATNVSDASKHTPMDLGSENNPEGKFACYRGSDGKLLYRPLRKDEEPGGEEFRMVSHYATCTKPRDWSRSKPRQS